MSTTPVPASWFSAVNTHLAAEAVKARKPILNSSWAVWKDPGPDGYTFQSDTAYPGHRAAQAAAHGEVIWLGLNPGSDENRLAWSNFHSSTTWTTRHKRTLIKNPSNDHLIAAAAQGTGLWGGLMTDLFHTRYESLSAKVIASVQGTREAEAGVGRLCELIARMPPSASGPLVLCLGDQTHKATKEAIARLTANGKNKAAALLNYIAVTHYSSRAHRSHGSDPATYRLLVHDAIRNHGRSDLL